MSKLNDLQFAWAEKRKADCASMLIAGLQSLMVDGLSIDEAANMPDAIVFVEAFLDECGDATELREDIAYSRELLIKATAGPIVYGETE